MRKNRLPSDDDEFLDYVTDKNDPKDIPDAVLPMGMDFWEKSIEKWEIKHEEINLDDVAGELKSMIWVLKLICRDLEQSENTDPRMIAISLALRDLAVIIKEKLS